MRLNPYLSFDGNCREAFAFYAAVLGGRMMAMLTWADMPADAKQQQPAEGCGPTQMPADKIMHACMEIDGVLLMGGDAPPGMYQKPAGATVALNIDDPAEAERVYNTLSQGGSVTMPLGETFWARRFGMFTDRFGTPWMVNCAREPHAAQAAE
ncbi:MAG TPA: VOC family protein [Ferrovibrio sp.]|jgi:PhnB protein|uniref:VOC family protein n=1 Tax=Ferrovibrio sp. TaxID=1917215 RepID=UPI002ECFE66F